MDFRLEGKQALDITQKMNFTLKGAQSVFKTQKEAEDAARSRDGSEVIIKDDEGYKLYSMDDLKDPNMLLSQNISDLPPNVVSFSIQSKEQNAFDEYEEKIVNKQEILVKNFIKDLTGSKSLPEEQIVKLFGFKNTDQMMKMLKDIPFDKLQNILEQINKLDKTDSYGFSESAKGILVTSLQSSIESLYTEGNKPKFATDEGIKWAPQELGMIYSSLYNLKTRNTDGVLFDRPVTFQKTRNSGIDSKQTLTSMVNKMMNISSTDGKTIYITEGAITGDMNKEVRGIVRSKLSIMQRVNSPGFYSYTPEELKERYTVADLDKWYKADKTNWRDKSTAQLDAEFSERAKLYTDMIDRYVNDADATGDPARYDQSMRFVKNAIVSMLNDVNSRTTDEYTKGKITSMLDKMSKATTKDDLKKFFTDPAGGSLSSFSFGVFQQVSFIVEKFSTTRELKEFINLSRPKDQQMPVDGGYDSKTIKALQQFQMDQTLKGFEDKINEKMIKALEKGDKEVARFYSTLKDEMGGLRTLIYTENPTFEDMENIFAHMLDFSQLDSSIQNPAEVKTIMTDMQSEFGKLKTTLDKLSSRSMDEKTINLIVSNMFNIMQDGKSNMLENLIVHESGHLLQSSTVSHDSDGSALNLTKEWKKIDGFNISKASGVTDTWNPQDIESFSVYGQISRNEDIAECFRGYTSINDDLKHPIELMRTSPIKFLTLNAVAGRYDMDTVLKIATMAFGSQQMAMEKLFEAFEEITGKYKGPHFQNGNFSPEFIQKIVDTHKTLIENLNILFMGNMA